MNLSLKFGPLLAFFSICFLIMTILPKEQESFSVIVMGQSYSSRSRSNSGVRSGALRPQRGVTSPTISPRLRNEEELAQNTSHNVQIFVETAYDEVGVIPETDGDLNPEPAIVRVEDMTRLPSPRPSIRKGHRRPTYQDVERMAGEAFGLGETPVELKPTLKHHLIPPTRNRSSSLTEEKEGTAGLETVPCVFKWTSSSASAFVRYQGQSPEKLLRRPREVYLRGSFNGWNLVPMTGSSAAFVTILDIPIGSHHYQYIVDGQVAFDPTQALDMEGNVTFNVLKVDLSDKDAFEALDIDIRTKKHGISSDDGFGQVFPQSSRCKNSSPPVLPPHLLQVILNKETPIVCEPTLLPKPNHVMINHVYALSIKDNVIVMSLTSRFRKKYVTSVIYKPAY